MCCDWRFHRRRIHRQADRPTPSGVGYEGIADAVDTGNIEAGGYTAFQRRVDYPGHHPHCRGETPSGATALAVAALGHLGVSGGVAGERSVRGRQSPSRVGTRRPWLAAQFASSTLDSEAFSAEIYTLNSAMFGFDDGEFKVATGAIFVGLCFFGILRFIPLISLIPSIPIWKEVLLGTIAVTVFTSIDDVGEGIKFALLGGMIAAVMFNILYIPSQILFSSVVGAATETGAGAGAFLGTLGAFANLIGVIIFSPIGYTIGGALGASVN